MKIAHFLNIIERGETEKIIAIDIHHFLSHHDHNF